MIRFHCPTCRRKLKVPDEYAGKSCKCRCGKVVSVPLASEEPRADLGPAKKSPSSSVMPALVDTPDAKVLWQRRVGSYLGPVPAGVTCGLGLGLALWDGTPLPWWLTWPITLLAAGWLGLALSSFYRSVLTITNRGVLLQQGGRRTEILHSDLGLVQAERGTLTVTSAGQDGTHIEVALSDAAANEAAGILKKQKARLVTA